MVTRSTLGVAGQRASSALQDAGGGALADRDAAGHADDVGDLTAIAAEEALWSPNTASGWHGDIKIEQARQRQIDRHHLVEIDAVIEAAQFIEIGVGQRQRRVGAQARPFGAREDAIG